MTNILPLTSLIRSAIPMVWDESLSYVEFLASLQAKVNELVAATNLFISQDLSSFVQSQLNIWLADGTLEDLINPTLLADLTAIKGTGYTDETVKGASDLAAQALARIGARNTTGAALLEPLLTAAEDITINIVGDSTGNDIDEWVYRLAVQLAAISSGYNVNHYLYNDSTGLWAKTALKTVGAAKKMVCLSLGQYARWLPSNVVQIGASDDIDIRMKFRVSDWYAGQERNMISKYVASDGVRCWKIYKNAAGAFMIDTTPDGTGGSLVSTGGGATISGLAVDTDYYMRFVFDANNGAGGRTFAVYISTDDGANWIQIGTTSTTAGVTTIDKNDSVPYNVLGASSTCDFIGEVTKVEIMNAIGGYNLAPISMEGWEHYPTAEDGPQILTGVPEINIYNASIAGASLETFLASNKVQKASPNNPKPFVFINLSHNDRFYTGGQYDSMLDNLVQRIQDTVYQPTIIMMTQNPQNPNARKTFHDIRRRQLMQFSKIKGFDCIDVYKAFQNYVDAGGELTDLVTGDVHPTSAGNALWYNTIWDYLIS